MYFGPFWWFFRSVFQIIIVSLCPRSTAAHVLLRHDSCRIFPQIPPKEEVGYPLEAEGGYPLAPACSEFPQIHTTPNQLTHPYSFYIHISPSLESKRSTLIGGEKSMISPIL